MASKPPPVVNHVASEFTRLATLSHLPALLAFLDAEAQAAGIDDATLFPLHLAVEEACANVIRHAYPDQPGPLTLRLDITPQTATATLLDTAPVFDPVHAPTPPLEGAVEERPLGGLGWHFIRSLMDEVRHEAQPEGGNRLTLIKHRPTNS